MLPKAGDNVLLNVEVVSVDPTTRTVVLRLTSIVHKGKPGKATPDTFSIIWGD